VKEYGTEQALHSVAIQNEIGESPIWVPEENRVYWADTEKSSITYWNPDSCETGCYSIDMPVTALVRRRGGGWVLITKKGLAFWDQSNNTCTPIVDPVASAPDLAFNDGAVDPRGRLLAGTMNFRDVKSPEGCLYCLDTDLNLKILDEKICTANGIGFSPDGKIAYVSEQWDSKILAYDYNLEKGAVSNKRIFAEVDSKDGYPDGIIVDSEGFIWNGRWEGHQIVRYAPDGTMDRKYNLPEETNTCVGFGGKDMKTLFIATAWYGKDIESRCKEPYAGDLYRLRTDVTGIVEPRFAG
jgi:L-arabinonolactonase